MTNLHKYDSSKCLSYDRQGLQNCETTAVRVCYFFAAFFSALRLSVIKTDRRRVLFCPEVTPCHRMIFP